jgi:NADH:ubiquinone oxidoreductase subunit 2 (subunit N)
MAVAAVLYYVLVYAVATLGAFACVAWMSGDKKEATATHEWSGLASRHPMMALGMTICLLSLMGMPPTAGFIGKLWVFRAAFEHDQFWLRFLVVAALVNAVIGAYYYLRLVVAMYFRPPPDRPLPVLPESGAKVVVGGAALLSLVLGLGADAAMRRTELAAAGFVFPVGSEKRAEWVDRLRARWETEERDAELAELPPVMPHGGDDARADGEPEAQAPTEQPPPAPF